MAISKTAPAKKSSSSQKSRIKRPHTKPTLKDGDVLEDRVNAKILQLANALLELQISRGSKRS